MGDIKINIPSNEQFHQGVTLSELFNTAVESLRTKDLASAYSALSAIYEGALKLGKTEKDLVELRDALEIITRRIRENISPSDDVISIIMALVESSRNKILRLP